MECIISERLLWQPFVVARSYNVPQASQCVANKLVASRKFVIWASDRNLARADEPKPRNIIDYRSWRYSILLPKRHFRVYARFLVSRMLAHWWTRQCSGLLQQLEDSIPFTERAFTKQEEYNRRRLTRRSQTHAIQGRMVCYRSFSSSRE